MTGSVVNGHPCWVDLSTADVAAAEHFYTQLLGWSVRTEETPMGRYLIGSVGEREVGGMMAQPPEAAGSPSMWTVFIYVDELDDTLGRISSAGGTVRQTPFEIPGGARVAVAADPSGAMFALISEGLQPGPYLSTSIGAVSWIELMTRRPGDAADFYGTVFGWTAETDDAAGTPYTAFGLDDTPVAGMIETPAHLPDDVPDGWSVYFTVADCQATEALVAELGGQVVLPTTPTPMGPFAVLADDQGAVFQVMELTAGLKAAGAGN